MKRLLAIFVIIAAMGVAASFLLIPNQQDVDYLHKKDLEKSDNTKELEEKYRKGDHSWQVVEPLSRLTRMAGKPDKALKVMELFTKENPGDKTALENLLVLYQLTEQKTLALETEAKLGKETETGKRAHQIDVLNRMIKKREFQSAQELSDLAYALSRMDLSARALGTLDAIKQNYRDGIKPEHVALTVSLLARMGERKAAYEAAAGWLKEHKDPAQAAVIISSLAANELSAEASSAADEMGELLKDNPDLTASAATAYLSAGKDDKAFRLLSNAFEAGEDRQDLLLPLLALAIQRNERELAEKTLKKIDLAKMDETSLLSLLDWFDSSGNTGQLKALSEVLRKNGNPSHKAIRAALLAINGETPDLADIKSLPTDQKLVIARLLLRKKLTLQALEIADSLNSPSLKNSEARDVASLYLLSGAPEKAMEIMASRPALAKGELAARIAAATGDDEKAASALSENPGVPLLKDMYFLAANSGNHKLAVRIGEKWLEAENSDQAKSFLSSSYIKTGEYKKALETLSSMERRGDTDNDAITIALSNMAIGSKPYEARLKQYAGLILAGDGYSEKRKLTTAYILNDNRQRALIKPELKKLADSKGGVWKKLAGGETRASKPVPATRESLLSEARGGKITAKARRGIAFALLEKGYRDDAEQLISETASGKAPDSEDVKLLLYLWGPRPDSSRLEWLRRQAENATPEQRRKWLELLANRGGAKQIEELAMRDGFISSEGQDFIYLSALPPEKLPAPLMQRIKRENDEKRLMKYAKLALANNLYTPTRTALSRILKQNPKNSWAHLALARVAFAEGDYSTARPLLDRYNALDKKQDAEKAESYFLQASLASREEKTATANAYYSRAASVIRSLPSPGIHERSMLGFSLIKLGRTEEGKAVYAKLLSEYPGDITSQLDEASALTETADYENAEKTASARLSPRLATSAISMDGVAAAEISASQNELLLRLDNPADQNPWVKALAASPPPWASFVTTGYDNVLIGAKEGYSISVTSQNGTRLEASAFRNGRPLSKEAKAKAENRRELLLARIELETGRVDEATNRLASLAARNPHDSEILGFAASAEFYAGREAKARNLISSAAGIAPQNEDVTKLKRDIDRASPLYFARVSHESRFIGDSSEHRTGFAAGSGLGGNLSITAETVRNMADGTKLTRASGLTGDFSEERMRYEISLSHESDSGAKSKLSLFGNDETLGGGLEYGFLSALGRTVLGLEYRRPYWDFIQAVLDSATRDRAFLSQTIKPRPWLTFSGTAAYNRYSVPGFDNAGETASFSANIITRLRKAQPFVAAGYGFDGEYALDETLSRLGGRSYEPLGITSREVHSLTLLANYDLLEDLKTEGYIGYSLDRFGGASPAIALKFDYTMLKNLDAEFRTAYGIGTQGMDDSIFTIGGYLSWRF